MGCACVCILQSCQKGDVHNKSNLNKTAGNPKRIYSQAMKNKSCVGKEGEIALCVWTSRFVGGTVA